MNFSEISHEMNFILTILPPFLKCSINSTMNSIVSGSEKINRNHHSLQQSRIFSSTHYFPSISVLLLHANHPIRSARIDRLQIAQDCLAETMQELPANSTNDIELRGNKDRMLSYSLATRGNHCLLLLLWMMMQGPISILLNQALCKPINKKLQDCSGERDLRTVLVQ